MRNNYQRKDRKSNHKFEVVGGQELMVRVPLPMAEVWAEMQAHVEQRNSVAEGTPESVGHSAEGGQDSRSCLNLDDRVPFDHRHVPRS